jgi:glycosyltransferase involved in cell wall biosynthesis
MRILLGLTEVSGHYGSLKQGFRELGVQATFWNLSGHPFAYGNEDNPLLVRWIRRIAARQKRATHSGAKIWLALVQVVLRSVLLLWALWKFDVFIFGFNTSFMRHYDLPLLKLLGKRIVYQFHGSDSRPPYLDGSICPPNAKFDVEECIKATRAKKRTLQTIGRNADVIIDNPTGGHFHERPFVIWLYVGLTSPASYEAKVICEGGSLDESGSPVRILHCPSNPVAKGTDHIERIINRLKAKGHAIEFVKITGRPNEEVLRELGQCDFVVDQAYSDYAMPGLATEAAWFGKPLVIGGYASELWQEIMAQEDRPPSLYCHPERMEAEIERLIADKAHRKATGIRVRQFVETHWRPREAARRYLQLLEGQAPDQWWFDPGQVNYLQGCCAPETWIRDMVRQMVESAGSQALMVSDKPELERRLCEFGRQALGDPTSTSTIAYPQRYPRCA